VHFAVVAQKEPMAKGVLGPCVGLVLKVPQLEVAPVQLCIEVNNLGPLLLDLQPVLDDCIKDVWRCLGLSLGML
jgi:hypothetical protein